MDLEHIASVIRNLRGHMPESLRTLVAHRMLTEYLSHIPQSKRNKKDDDLLINAFNEKCGLISGLPFVKHDIILTDSDISTFCNRWMNAEKFRRDGEWMPFTEDMNSVRATMCKELEAMSKGPHVTYYSKDK